MRRGLENLSLTVLALHLIYLWASCTSLPDTIPTHFNAAGQPDDFGSKDSIWSLWFVSLGLYAMFAALSFVPLRSSLWNLPEHIKEDTSGRSRPLVNELMAWLKLLTVSIFFFLSWLTVRTAQGVEVAWGVPVLIVSGLFLPLLILAVYLYKMGQLKKE